MFRQFLTFVCHGKAEDFSAYHVQLPGSLPDSVKKSLFESLYPIALDAFGQKPTEAFEDDVRQHPFSYDHLAVVADDFERPIAFRMWQGIPLEGKKVLYLAGMCVKTALRRSGREGS